tara:strand:+ start:16314 stop:16550 length:237 start_codon:yes stop_codon:yes gene_type:complete
MSLVIDIVVWLLIDSIVGFFLYSTGCLILKIVTFDQFEIEFKAFTSFKKSKAKKVNLIMLLGLSFYALIIVLIVYLNN